MSGNGKELNVDTLYCKLNNYCVHRLLWENKRLGMNDKDIWAEIKDLFQSEDYNLFMELRPIEMIWGDTSKIDDLLKTKNDEADR